MAFQIATERNGDTINVYLHGDLDINSSPVMKTSVLEALESGPCDILFDLEDLQYMDSTGLGALISIYKAAQENDNVVSVRGARPNVKKLFKITELYQLFNMED